MIARTLSKLYPAPIALCQHDLIGTIEQITNDLTRLMIADISETRAAQATNQTNLEPPPAARGLSLTLSAGIWGSFDTYLGVIQMARFIKWKGNPKRYRT
jgi:hypothetical protein